MGKLYRDAVGSCLSGEFGLGDEESLQTVVYIRIVRVLDRTTL